MKFYNALPLSMLLKSITGSAGASIANLIISILLISKTNPQEYGVYALLMIIQSFANGLSNATIGAPLFIAMTGSGEGKVEAIYAHQKINLIFCLLFSIVQFSVCYILLDSLQASLLAAILALVTTYKWFCRAFLNNQDRHAIVIRSDLAYMVLIFMGVFVLYLNESASLNLVFIIMIYSSVAGVLFLGTGLIRETIAGLLYGRIILAKQGFFNQGRFALLGVLSSEAMVNGHAYIVSFVFGSAAFSVIAIANLFFRPLDIIFSTITQIIRPRLRVLFLSNEKSKIKFLLTSSLLLAFVAWLIILSIGFVFDFNDGWVYLSGETHFIGIEQAFYLFSIIYLFRILRNPISMFLQCSDNFESLSLATVKSASFTLLCILIGVGYFDAVDSLYGIIFGEILFLVFLVKLIKAKKWMM